MIPLTTLEAAARVAAHAAGRAARLHTGPAVLPPGEDRASPSEAVEIGATPTAAPVRRVSEEPVRGRVRGRAPGPMRGPVRGNEQSADGAAGMLLRTG